MKKLIKGLLVFTAVVLVLLLTLVIALPMVFDPNDHKQAISKTIKDSIGRDVRLDGEIKWSVFPSIALSFNDVKLSNEAGFKGDYMAEMAALSAQVKLLPLFKKDIQIGTVTLQSPQINLKVNRSGQSNWQGIIDTLGSGATTTSTSDSADSSGSMAIRGINITGGEINYADDAAGVVIQLSEVNFNTNQLSAVDDSDIEISAQVDMPNQSLSGLFESQILAKNLLNDQGISLLFNELQFIGQLSSGSRLPLVLKTDETGLLDLGKDTIDFNQMVVELGAIKLSTSVTGNQISEDMKLSGNLVLNKFDLDEFLQQLDAPLVNDANNEMSGKASWQFGQNTLSINGLVVNLDDYVLNGDFNIDNIDKMRGTFNLSMDSFDADPYIPQSDSTTTETAAGESGALDFGRLQGNVTIGKLTFAGLSLDNITLKMATNGNEFTVQPLQADFYQGLIKTELQLKPNNENNKLQLTHKMSDIQAGNMLTDLMGSEFMTGLGKLDANLYIDEPFSERPFKTAHGTIQYSLTDGDIVGIDVFDIIQKSLSLMGNQEAMSTNSDLKTAFGLMELDAEVDQGILKTNKLSLTSPYFDVKGNVTIDLDAQTIKGSIKPMLTNIPEGVLSDDYKKLLNLRIPVALSGSLLEPNIKIDIKELILETQKEKIEEKKEELKQDLFDKLLGNDKDKKTKNKASDGSTDSSTSAAENEGAELTEKEKKRARKKAQKKALLESLFKSKDDKKDEVEEDTGDGT
ncbi:AsmA family protein [Marinicella rhabdoformis]|uniref:AsmA family protein n=1 Tax=Marinicella rhabdoformis TaxID=2580566 RepID=UPI0012AEBF0C|nr:AsmA family protein [Marinicella rhabdoformis]